MDREEALRLHPITIEFGETESTLTIGSKVIIVQDTQRAIELLNAYLDYPVENLRHWNKE